MLPALNAEGKDLRTVSAELKGIVSNGNVTIRQAAHLHGLCSGLKIGCFTIEGDSGDYLGALPSFGSRAVPASTWATT
jgi:hypothetical protein